MVGAEAAVKLAISANQGMQSNTEEGNSHKMSGRLGPGAGGGRFG